MNSWLWTCLCRWSSSQELLQCPERSCALVQKRVCLEMRRWVGGSAGAGGAAAVRAAALACEVWTSSGDALSLAVASAHLSTCSLARVCHSVGRWTRCLLVAGLVRLFVCLAAIANDKSPPLACSRLFVCSLV